MYLKISKVRKEDAERPLRLQTLDGRDLGPIPFAYGVKFTINYTDLSEIEFTVPKMANGLLNPLYSAVTGYKLVYTPTMGVYVLQTPKREGDGMSETKTVNGYSLEYLFGGKTLFLEEGTYKFYDPTNKSESILGRILELDPSWGVGYVTPRLLDDYRTFDQYNSSALDFCYQDAMEKYRCAIVFDVYNKTISAYDAEADAESLPIYLSFHNLLSTVGIEEIDDEMTTKLRVYGSDNLSIRQVNPTGSDSIIDLDYFIQNGDLDTQIEGHSLADRVRSWEREIEAEQPHYSALSAARYSETALKLSLEAELADLKGELETLTTQQSVTVQALALEKDETGKNNRQAQLDEINAQIKQKKKDIEGKEDDIDGANDTLTDYGKKIEAVVNRLSFETYFKPEERAVLCPYLIEGEMSDETFVASDLDVESSSKTNHISGVVEVSGSDISGTYLEDRKKSVLSLSGGRLKIALAEIEGNIVNGSLDLGDSINGNGGEYVLSLSLAELRYGEHSYPRGMLTMHGRVRDFHWDAALDRETGLLYGSWFDFYAAGEKSDFSDSYFTVGMTEFDQYSTAMELYKFGQECLKDLAFPTYEFTVDSANFLYLDKFAPFRDEMKLGKCIHLNLDGDGVIDAKLIGFTLGMDDFSQFSLVFSNRYKLRNQIEGLRDEVNAASRATRTFDAGKYIYNRTADKTTQVGRYMDALKRGAAEAVLSSKNQSVVMDGSGIHIGGDGDFQLRLTDHMIAMTNNNWQDAKIGIGRFYTPETGDVFGVNAELLAGKLIIGNSMVLQNPQVDENNHPTGAMTFKVDATGAWLYNSRIVLQNEEKDGGVIAIDPRFGIVAGTKLLFDTNGTAITPEFMNEHGDLTIEKDGMPKNANFFLNGKTGDAYFRGKVYAKSGLIGGFTIAENDLHSGIGSSYVGINGAGTGTNSTYAFWAGNSDPLKANFWVKKDGTMSATGATFSGTLKASKISGNMTSDADGWIRGPGLSIGGDYETGEGNFFVDHDGSLTLKGNINLSDGNITWGNKNPARRQFADSINGPWHDDMGTGDKYRRDFLGVDENDNDQWGTPYQFVAEDGKPGAPGTPGKNALVTRANIVNAMLEHEKEDGLYSYTGDDGNNYLGINAIAIRTGILTSRVEISGPDIIGSKFYSENRGAYLVVGGDKNYGDLSLCQGKTGTKVFNITDGIGGVGLYSHNKKFLGVAYSADGAYCTPNGLWDFSNAKVEGITAVFG